MFHSHEILCHAVVGDKVLWEPERVQPPPPLTENCPLAAQLKLTLCGSRKYPDLHHGGNWKFQGGGGVRGPGNSRGEGGWTIKSLSGGKYHFIFDLSSNIASYRTVRSFLEHK